MTVTADRAETTTPSAVIDRVSLVLEAFEGPGRLTLAQIVRRTGLPRSSAHRMLERLVALRWLRRSGRDVRITETLMRACGSGRQELLATRNGSAAGTDGDTQ